MPELDLQSLLRPRRSSLPGAPSTSGTVATPERELSAPRVARDSLRDACEVLRSITGTDAYGGQSQRWALEARYPCSVRSTGLSPQEGASGGGQISSEVDYEVLLPREANVRPSDRIGVPGWFNAWASQSTAAPGEKVIPATPQAGNGHFYECVEGGATGLVEPHHADPDDAGDTSLPWPTQPGATIRDGGVLWREAGSAHFLEVVGSSEARSEGDLLIVRAKELT